jgi:PIN domain nuclease of toxin-antitoxin system
MASSFLLDSCIWIGYFTGDKIKSKEIIESQNNCFTSVLSIFEISNKLERMGVPKTIIENILETIESKSIILDLNLEISKKASKNSKKYGLFAVDSLLFTTSQIKEIVFVTADKHFSKTPNTLLI